MRHATRAVVLGLVAVIVVVPGSLQAAPTVAQRRELAGIRRDVLKVPALLRRRKVSEARETLNYSNKRLR